MYDLLTVDANLIVLYNDCLDVWVLSIYLLLVALPMLCNEVDVL